MGRIKGRHLKVAAKDLLKKAGDKFSESFEHNKAVLKEHHILEGNTIERNKLAGDISRQKKAQLKAIAQAQADAN